jgi:DNA-binding beta-propeller fold protein YncE
MALHGRNGRWSGWLLALLLGLPLVLPACGGGSGPRGGGGLIFDPAETTPTRIFSANHAVEALLQPTTFTVKVRLTLNDRRTADTAAAGPPGRNVAAAMELAGSAVPVAPAGDGSGGTGGTGDTTPEEPLAIATPIAITLHGISGFIKGSSIPLYQYNTASGIYEQSGQSARISDDGTAADFSIGAFGRFALFTLIPAEQPPAAPAAPTLVAASTQIRKLAWPAPAAPVLGYNLYRAAAGTDQFTKVNSDILLAAGYSDQLTQAGGYRYRLTALSSSGLESEQGAILEAPAVSFDLLTSFGTGALNTPTAVLLDAPRGRLLVADPPAAKVYAFATDGALLHTYSSYQTGTAMLDPLALAAAPDGSKLYVADGELDTVYVLDPDFGYLGEFGGTGPATGQFMRPLAVTAFGDKVLVADWDTGRLQSFTPLGVYLATLASGGTGNGEFAQASGLLVTRDGGLLVSDGGNNRLELFGNDLKYKAVITLPAADGGPLIWPAGLAEDFRKRIYVSDTGNARIVVLDSSGKFVFHFGSEGSLPVELGNNYGPAGLAYDPTTGYLYVADPGNHRIAVFAT